MTLSRRVLMSIMVLLLFMPGAWSMNMGGGASVSVSSPGSVQGNFAANSNGAVSTATSTGQVVLGQTYWVQDSTGKRAEMLLNVVNGKISKYRAEFSPRQGKVPSTSKVSAKQTLDISGADKITTHTKAVNAAGDSASVDLQIDRVGSYGAQFKGETDSYATANSAFANVDGDLKGDLSGTAMAGSSQSKTRDSNGGRVDCDLVMNAYSANKKGSIGGKTTFNVDDDWSGKIQSAVDAAWDGDLIKVAPGTYKENVVIDKSLKLAGSGAGSTIVDGNNAGSVFKIGEANPNIDVDLADMAITNGKGTYKSYEYSPGQSLYLWEGGGIYNKGRATIESCTIYGNFAAGLGGGIYNEGTATLTGSTLRENNVSAERPLKYNTAGGGFYNSGSASIVNSIVTGNYGWSSGGIGNKGIAEIKGCTISGNSADDGGGINNIGTASIEGNTISGNSAHSGGGISNIGTASIVDNTITGNSADYMAGGIYNDGMATISGSTISGNSADSKGGGIVNRMVQNNNMRMGIIKLTDSIVSENSAEVGGGIFNDGGASTTIMGSTISKNSAKSGGGIWNGIFWSGEDGTPYPGTLNIFENSKIFLNIAQNHGGGIASYSGTVLNFKDMKGNIIPISDQRINDIVFNNHLQSESGPVDNISH